MSYHNSIFNFFTRVRRLPRPAPIYEINLFRPINTEQSKDLYKLCLKIADHTNMDLNRYPFYIDNGDTESLETMLLVFLQLLDWEDDQPTYP